MKKMLQFATHEIGRFHEVFKQFGQLFWESGGLLESEDFFKS
jgi:hypothetical protein